MTHSRTLAFLALLTAVPASRSASAQTSAQGPTSRIALTQVLPALNGATLEAKIAEVRYPPGGVSAAHRHPCAVIGFIIEGAMRTQVNDEPERVVRAGETFYEPPNAAHKTAANASQTEPLRFLAYFLCDRPTPLSIPLQGPANK